MFVGFFNLKESYNDILSDNLEEFIRSPCPALSHTVHRVNKLFVKHSGHNVKIPLISNNLLRCMLQEHHQKEALAIAGAIPHLQTSQKCSCITERQDDTKAAAYTDVTVSFMLNFQFKTFLKCHEDWQSILISIKTKTGNLF